MSATPSSLSNLRDPVLPDPVPWWPFASGWWVVGGLLAVWLLLVLIRALLVWRRNAYRRTAQRELAQLAAGTVPAGEISELMKRVALADHPRGEVASLSGSDWLAFLDQTGRTDAFSKGPGRVLATATSEPQSLADSDRAALLELCARWIRSHRVVKSDL